MSSEIHTEFEEPEQTDNGVETAFVAEEVFVFEGERVERETEVSLLEDGGIHIAQKTDQGMYDSLTLNADVARRLIRERDSDG